MLLVQGTRQVAPAVFIIAPVAVLTAISMAVLGLLLVAEGGPATPLALTVVAAGGLAYALAMLLLLRFGLTSIARLADLGLTDSLAGLPNRRALHRDFQAATQMPTALALLDLDGFKSVNDHYGHFVGDRLIKECARLLKDVCGTETRAYRLGGDEFAILAAGPIAGNILESVSRSLLARLAEPLEIDERRISVGVSVGLTRSTGKDGLTSSELLRRADMAMYASKGSGKNRCTWFSEELDRSRDHDRQIEIDLRLALERGEFHLAYQPLVDAASGEIVAVEALLRWQRADGCLMDPETFIPVAEKSGLIYPIGIWVLHTACREALDWDGIRLSVNVSPAQLRNPEFPISLGQVLEETGFPATRLELELTETFLVTDPTVANRQLDVIRKFGVGIALDDFGTGYASIGFLRNFRFEKLKIDRSMVVDAAKDGGSLAMMASSVAVARAMDMEVIAEGVETQAQADLVRTAGCDQIQGWFYYKAITAAEVGLHLSHRGQEKGIAYGHVA